MAGEPAQAAETAAETATGTARRQVKEVVAELPFEDDPTTFLATLATLADAHTLDEDE